MGNCDRATIIVTVVTSEELLVANDNTVMTEKNNDVDIFLMDNDDAVKGHPLYKNSMQGGEY